MNGVASAGLAGYGDLVLSTNGSVVAYFTVSYRPRPLTNHSVLFRISESPCP